MATATHKSLAEALVAAQSEMPAVERDGTNPHFRSSFTTLGHLIAKARPVLNKHGIAFVQLPSQDENGKPTLTTKLVHTSGDVMEESMPLFLPKSDPQGQGSALTYARRYALAAALGISDQEDDDGNAGTAAVETQAKKQDPKKLLALAHECGLDNEQVTTWIKANGYPRIPVSKDAASALAAIESLSPDQADKFSRACVTYKKDNGS